MAGVRLTLTLSVVCHAAVLSALAWFGATAPPLRGSTDPNPVRVIFEPPPAPAAPVAPAPPPAPPSPEPPALVAEPEAPPAPDVTAMPPPPIAKPKPPVPEAKPKPSPPLARPETKRRVQPRPDPPPERALPQYRPQSQEAALPPPVPPSWSPQPPRSAPAPSARPPAGSQVTPGYRTALARWFAVHKRYPEGARARGEQGQAILRFRVDRYGRVLGYSIVRSTGYPELDAAVAAMMRGAQLPPFPQDMAASEIEVSVPVRFTVSP